ncbi:glycosyltransferase [Vibrio fluvialis]|nr:glycosyltransferase [Vibrio fluvialis]
MNKLSLIIAAFNVEEYIEECLLSVVKQEFSNKFEIIIVNDGSTDKTEYLVDKIIRKHINQLDIKIITKKNGGLSDARNTGLRKASGDYIAFLDGDDILLPDYSKVLFGEISDNDIVSFNSQRFLHNVGDEYSKPVIISRNRFKNELMNTFDTNQWFAWARVYRKSLFKDVEFPLHRRFEDVATTPKLYLKANKIKHIDKPLIGYRINPSSITRNPLAKDISDILFAVKSIRKIDKEYSNRNIWDYSVRNLGGLTRFLYSNVPNNEINKKEVMELYKEIFLANLKLGFRDFRAKTIYNSVIYPFLVFTRVK